MVIADTIRSFSYVLDRKLLRDLWRAKGQVSAIVLVIAVGVLMLVMMDGLVNSLEQTKRAYYDRYRLADVFASLKRAPKHILRDIAELPGVSNAEARINGGALINLPTVAVPIRTLAVSLPDRGEPRLNDIYLAEGRRTNPSKEDEVLILRSFARAHNLDLGDRLSATMNGSRRSFNIVGIAQAPEFLYSAAPGEFVPDDARFAVLWMSERALAAAYDLEGAFNEVLISLATDARLPDVLDSVDRLLSSYGGLGAYGVEDQFSNRFVVEEIKGLEVSSRTVPPIFLAVAAFLLYIVISRMIESEREQIGLLKAFGYTNWEVSRHYFGFILFIAILGALLGCILGIVSGQNLSKVYQTYYKFPFLVFRTDLATVITAFAVTIAAASAGGLFILTRVFALTPAVAMNPPAPPDYSKSRDLGAFLKRFLDQPSRMVFRRLLRHPWRVIATVLGISAGMALSVSMLSIMSGFNQTLDLNFGLLDRSDVNVSFVEPLSDTTVYNLRRMNGVVRAEPYRVVSALLRNGAHSYRGGITGYISTPQLNRAVDSRLKPIHIRQEGVILSISLADVLNIKPGDKLTIEVREGRRPTIEIPVVGIAETLLGSPAYMEISALNRALKEPNRVSGAYLQIDQQHSEQIYREIKNMPTVTAVSLRQETREAFDRLLDSGAGAMRFIMTAIAFVITFGIVYNSARITFAERVRDLASLRVIGFTRAETAFVLLGELAVLVLIALPIGSAFGYYLTFLISEAFSTDIYRIPAIVVPSSYGVGALAVLFASAASGWLVRRDIDNIDVVASLKTRE